MARATITFEQAADLDQVRRTVDSALEETPTMVVLAMLCALAGRVQSLAEWEGAGSAEVTDAILANLRMGMEEGNQIIRREEQRRAN